MKQLSKIILIFFISSAIYAQQSLKLNVFSSKEEYLLGETVEIGINICNNSTNPIMTNLIGAITIKIQDENGHELPYIGPTGEHYAPRSSNFKPNEESYKVIELNDYFGEYPDTPFMDRYFKTGKYKIIVILAPPNLISDSVVIDFEVIEPTGNELVVYNKLMEIVQGVPKGIYERPKVAEMFSDLQNTYPNSVYCPIILRLLRTWYDFVLGDYQKGSEVENKLLERYPWSSKIIGIVEMKLKIMKSKSDKMEFLKKLEQGSRNSIMQKNIAQLLKEEIDKQ